MDPISGGGTLRHPPPHPTLPYPVGRAIKEIIGYFVIGSNPSKNHKNDFIPMFLKGQMYYEAYIQWKYLVTPRGKGGGVINEF